MVGQICFRCRGLPMVKSLQVPVSRLLGYLFKRAAAGTLSLRLRS